ncbi:MAG: RelA/SpoT AH/RIS domain-containing protein [Patescibacteria group bacterium]
MVTTKKAEPTRRWECSEPVPEAFLRRFSRYPRPIAQLLYNRGITTLKAAQGFLNPDYANDLHDPRLLSGMDAAVRTIRKAIAGNERIVVHGDYDADGLTAAALLADVLGRLGGAVETFVPSRYKEGYGVAAAPKRGWLQTVRTGHARNAIRRFFREQDRDVTVSEGRQLLSELLRRYRRPGRLSKDEWGRLRAAAGASSDDDVLAALGEGRVTQTALAKALGLAATPPTRSRRRPSAAGRFRVVIGQDLMLPTTFAACCGPRPLAAIVGYVTLHKTITIHRQSCGQLEKLPDPSRLVSARWESA